MCSVDWAEGPVVCSSNVRKARMTHRCAECSRDIKPGERYEAYSGLYDDSGWINCKTCSHCMAARSWLLMVCEGWVFEGVAEEIKDHWDEYGELALGRLVIHQREKWARITPEGVTEVVASSKLYQDVAAFQREKVAA